MAYYLSNLLQDAYRALGRTGDAAHAYHRALVAVESDEGVAAGKARRAALEGKLRELTATARSRATP